MLVPYLQVSVTQSNVKAISHFTVISDKKIVFDIFDNLLGDGKWLIMQSRS